MSPESLVGCALVDPVFVHVCQQVVLAEGLDEGIDAGTSVGRDDSAIGQTIGGVWAGAGIELAAEIAVLSIRAIAEVRPKAMQGPGSRWDQLTLALKASVCVPELGLEEKAAEGLRAAGIGCEGVCFG
jgi:hypothetical protein